MLHGSHSIPLMVAVAYVNFYQNEPKAFTGHHQSVQLLTFLSDCERENHVAYECLKTHYNSSCICLSDAFPRITNILSVTDTCSELFSHFCHHRKPSSRYV